MQRFFRSMTALRFCLCFMALCTVLAMPAQAQETPITAETLGLPALRLGSDIQDDLFVAAFTTLGKRGAHYSDIFQTFDADEKRFTLRLFTAGLPDAATDKDRARLALSAINFGETLNNLEHTIETGDVRDGDAVDISSKMESILKQYPSSASVLTPELVAQAKSAYDAANSAVIALVDQIKREREQIKREIEELKRQVELFRSLLGKK